MDRGTGTGVFLNTMPKTAGRVTGCDLYFIPSFRVFAEAKNWGLTAKEFILEGQEMNIDLTGSIRFCQLIILYFEGKPRRNI